MEAPVLRVGTVISVDGHEVVIVSIDSFETLEGRSLMIRAADKESADKLQHDIVEAAKIREHTIDSLGDLAKTVSPMLKKMFGDSQKGYE